ncbi:MAG: agmatine deiminase family protein [Bacteroidaceae bacterium]|nr:agmatine deiminase family protein [Bacteroidaceae bacterium]
MITDNLTNVVYFSSLLTKKCPILNAHITDELQKWGISYGYLSGTKDIWCRDFMPIQIERNRFVLYKYTPDYLQDKFGLRIQTNSSEVLQTEDNQLQSIWRKCSAIDLVIDGGNVVKCGDVVVMTDKVFVENKDKSRLEVERILRDAFLCDILFLPWDRQEYLGHSDGIVHYAGTGRILLTNYDVFSSYFYNRFRKLLEARFEVIPLRYKTKRKHARSWAYINYLQVGSLVLVPQLGLEEDKQALEQISNALPECKVVGIPALEAVRRGGAFNCISWNIHI